MTKELVTSSKDIIDEINKAILTLSNFPATKNRLVDIRYKLEKNKLLSANDFETLRLNRIPV